MNRSCMILNYLPLGPLHLAGNMARAVDQMLRYQHIKYSDNEERNCIIAAESKHHNDFRIARSPLLRKWIADLERHVIVDVHRL